MSLRFDSIPTPPFQVPFRRHLRSQEHPCLLSKPAYTFSCHLLRWLEALLLLLRNNAWDHPWQNWNWNTSMESPLFDLEWLAARLLLPTATRTSHLWSLSSWYHPSQPERLPLGLELLTGTNRVPQQKSYMCSSLMRKHPLWSPSLARWLKPPSEH